MIVEMGMSETWGYPWRGTLISPDSQPRSRFVDDRGESLKPLCAPSFYWIDDFDPAIRSIEQQQYDNAHNLKWNDPVRVSWNVVASGSLSSADFFASQGRTCAQGLPLSIVALDNNTDGIVFLYVDESEDRLPWVVSFRGLASIVNGLTQVTFKPYRLFPNDGRANKTVPVALPVMPSGSLPGLHWTLADVAPNGRKFLLVLRPRSYYDPFPKIIDAWWPSNNTAPAVVECTVHYDENADPKIWITHEVLKTAGECKATVLQFDIVKDDVIVPTGRFIGSVFQSFNPPSGPVWISPFINLGLPLLSEAVVSGTLDFVPIDLDPPPGGFDPSSPWHVNNYYYEKEAVAKTRGHVIGASYDKAGNVVYATIDFDLHCHVQSYDGMDSDTYGLIRPDLDPGDRTVFTAFEDVKGRFTIDDVPPPDVDGTVFATAHWENSTATAYLRVNGVLRDTMVFNMNPTYWTAIVTGMDFEPGVLAFNKFAGHIPLPPVGEVDGNSYPFSDVDDPGIEYTFFEGTLPFENLNPSLKWLFNDNTSGVVTKYLTNLYSLRVRADSFDHTTGTVNSGFMTGVWSNSNKLWYIESPVGGNFKWRGNHVSYMGTHGPGHEWDIVCVGFDAFEEAYVRESAPALASRGEYIRFY